MNSTEAIEHLAAMAEHMQQDIRWRVVAATPERQELIRRANEIVENAKAEAA